MVGEEEGVNYANDVNQETTTDDNVEEVAAKVQSELFLDGDDDLDDIDDDD